MSSPTLRFGLLLPMQPPGLLKMPSGPHDVPWDVLALSLESQGFGEALLLNNFYGALNSTATNLNLTWRFGEPTVTQSSLAFIPHLATLLPPLIYPKPRFPLLCQGCLFRYLN